MKPWLLSFLLVVLASRYAASSVAITTTSVANGTVKTAYSAVIKASGGCTPYKWTIASGALPAGVTAKVSSTTTSLNLAGTPTTAATYSFTEKVTGCGGHVSQVSYKVVIQAAANVSLSVSPSTASLQTGGQQQFTASVSGTSNTAVTWSVSGGTVTTRGLYVAPSAAGTYTVTAVSAADSTKSASATVSVSAPQAISISISPTTVAMPQKWQQQFAATVSGSSNTAATWAVTKGTGTITQSGLFTAPQAVETDIVVATSQADSTKSASANITVVAPHSVALSWSPSSSPGISSYKVYRGTASGGPYSLLRNGVSSTSYTDSNVQSGSTYYYVTTAVDSGGVESAYSGEAPAVIPMP